MSIAAALDAIPLGEREVIGGKPVQRCSLFGFRVGGGNNVWERAQAAALLQDSGGAAIRDAARDQTQREDANPATCTRPSPSAGIKDQAAAEGAAEGVRWHAASADSVHVVLEEWVERHKPGRRSWERRQGQAVCKPRGFRNLVRTAAAPNCKRCLDGVVERGITLGRRSG